MNIKTLGIDLAKNVFQLHGADKHGKCVEKKRLSRAELKEYVANIEPTTIAIEACGGAHAWARCFESYGHKVKMMSPQFVKPYVKSHKTDKNDAEAIAEAATRPHMRFVPVKTIEQQDSLMLHRARELAIKMRTMQANQIRGMLLEYGLTIPMGLTHIKQLPVIIDSNQDALSGAVSEVLLKSHALFNTLDEQVNAYDKQLKALAKQDGVCQEIQKIPGVGPIIATAIIATIGDAKLFKNGREVSAWLGLTPRQHSSGNKVFLGGISKRGDRYMRKLLIQGARTAIYVCDKKTDKLSRWAASKKEKGGFNKAAVALANKNVRMIWAIMRSGECYRQPAMN